MMSLLMTPLLAAAVAADRHAEVWARHAAAEEIQVAAADAAPVRVAPVQMALGGPPPGYPPPPMSRPGEGPPRFGPQHGYGGQPHGPPYLRGLALTDAQQDKVFDILHAQAPQLRQRERDLAKAGEELRSLARADSFDEARATAAAEASGRAAAAIALIHARSEATIWQVLTPEQRKQVAERPRSPEMPPGAMRPPQ